jgi:hypothetical protein
MTPQERELLTSFLQQMTQAQTGPKDTEAETLISAACAKQPDAAYLLVQRAMQLEYALQTVQSQSARLQAEIDKMRPATPTGFLDNANAWGRGTPAAAAPPAAASAAAQPRSQPGSPAPVGGSSWGSGMLGTVASTAAGVVAGSFLFQGIQGLMGQHGGGAQHGANAGATPLQPATETTASSDRYDDSAPDDSTDLADAGDGDLGDLA